MRVHDRAVQSLPGHGIYVGGWGMQLHTYQRRISDARSFYVSFMCVRVRVCVYVCVCVCPQAQLAAEELARYEQEKTGQRLWTLALSAVGAGVTYSMYGREVSEQHERTYTPASPLRARTGLVCTWGDTGQWSG